MLESRITGAFTLLAMRRRSASYVADRAAFDEDEDEDKGPLMEKTLDREIYMAESICRALLRVRSWLLPLGVIV